MICGETFCDDLGRRGDAARELAGAQIKQFLCFDGAIDDYFRDGGGE